MFLTSASTDVDTAAPEPRTVRVNRCGPSGSSTVVLHVFFLSARCGVVRVPAAPLMVQV